MSQLLFCRPNASATPFFSEGWESGANTGSFQSDFRGNISGWGGAFVVQSSEVAEGGFALRHDFTSGQTEFPFATQHFADASEGPIWPTLEGEHIQDIILAYRFRYSAGFQFPVNYKQFIMGTQDDRTHAAECCNPWVAHYLTIYVDDDSALRVEGNNKQGPGSTAGFFEMGPNVGYNTTDNKLQINTGQWYAVRVRRALNTDGDNGIFQMWVDDVLVANHENVRHRIPWDGTRGANYTYGTNFLMMSDFATQAVPQDQDVFYDSVTLTRND